MASMLAVLAAITRRAAGADLLVDTWSTSAWDTTKWTLSGNFTPSVVSGAGRFTAVNAAPFYGAASARITAVQNVGILCRFQTTGTQNSVRLYLRETGTLSNYAEPGTTLQGLALEIDTQKGVADLTRFNQGNNLGLGSISMALPVSTWFWVRFELVGSTCRARMWKQGATEPTTWGVNVTDTSVVQVGSVLLTSANYQASAGEGWTCDFDDVDIYAAA